jgi:hypothetical protein
MSPTQPASPAPTATPTSLAPSTPQAPRPSIVVTNHDPDFMALLQALLTDAGYDAMLPPDAPA